MKVKILSQMLAAFVISAVSLEGISVPANAQQEQQQQAQQEQRLREAQQRQQQQQERRLQQQREVEQRQQQEQYRQTQQQEHRLQQQREVEQRAQQQEQERRLQQQREVEQRQQQEQYRQTQQQEHSLQQQRLSEQRQQQLIQQQQNRLAQYRQQLEQQQRLAQQHIASLQQQHRLAQYRFQQQYRERLRQQYLRLQAERDYDYYHDPYFYTPPNCRYYHDGRYYETNEYGAELLRQAVDYGYEEGFRTGQADQEDGWSYDYRDSYAYQDANYGYNGYYVSPEEYHYYFRAGFRHGYEDGYNSRYQYGTYADGKYAILAEVLAQILNLQPIFKGFATPRFGQGALSPLSSSARRSCSAANCARFEFFRR